MTKYWIAAISKDHALRGIQENFVQVCHGKQSPLKRMAPGDYIIIYSSKFAMTDKEKYQRFTAIGQISDKEIYSFQMAENFIPFRRKVQFLPCKECAIVPLIPDLDFIPNKKMWGYPFRYGLFEISEKDYNLIASKMIMHE